MAAMMNRNPGFTTAKSIGDIDPRDYATVLLVGFAGVKNPEALKEDPNAQPEIGVPVNPYAVLEVMGLNVTFSNFSENNLPKELRAFLTLDNKEVVLNADYPEDEMAISAAKMIAVSNIIKQFGIGSDLPRILRDSAGAEDVVPDVSPVSVMLDEKYLADYWLDVFACEFMMPSSFLFTFLYNGLKPSQIAEATGMSIALVKKWVKHLDLVNALAKQQA